MKSSASLDGKVRFSTCLIESRRKLELAPSFFEGSLMNVSLDRSIIVSVIVPESAARGKINLDLKS